jgi:hypothetical protein
VTDAFPFSFNLSSPKSSSCGLTFLFFGIRVYGPPVSNNDSAIGAERSLFYDSVQQQLRGVKLPGRRLAYALENLSGQIDAVQVALLSRLSDNRLLPFFPQLIPLLTRLRMIMQSARAEHAAVLVRVEALISFLLDSSMEKDVHHALFLDMLEILSKQVYGLKHSD